MYLVLGEFLPDVEIAAGRFRRMLPDLSRPSSPLSRVMGWNRAGTSRVPVRVFSVGCSVEPSELIFLSKDILRNCAKDNGFIWWGWFTGDRYQGGTRNARAGECLKESLLLILEDAI